MDRCAECLIAADECPAVPWGDQGEGPRGARGGEGERAEPGPNAGSPVRLRPGPARGARIAHDIRTTIYSVAVEESLEFINVVDVTFELRRPPAREHVFVYTRASDVKSELQL